MPLFSKIVCVVAIYYVTHYGTVSKWTCKSQRNNMMKLMLIDPTYLALSLHDMETMKIQMDECKTCEVTAHQMYLDFLDRVILIANNNNKNNKDDDNIKEESSSASVDLNILLPSLFGSIATVTVAVVGVVGGVKYNEKRNKKKKSQEKNGNPAPVSGEENNKLIDSRNKQENGESANKTDK